VSKESSAMSTVAARLSVGRFMLCDLVRSV
jgi:hypothetical protein